MQPEIIHTTEEEGWMLMQAHTACIHWQIGQNCCQNIPKTLFCPQIPSL